MIGGFDTGPSVLFFGVGPDIQGNDIIDFTAIDGSDDFEIDGYFVPESDDDSVIHLFQSKRRSPGTGMGPGEIPSFLNAPNRILDTSQVAASRNEETKSLHDRIVNMISQGDGKCSLDLVWVTSGTLTTAARNNISGRSSWTVLIPVDIPGGLTEIAVTLRCLDLFDLYQEHEAQQNSDDSSYNCDHVFYVDPLSYHRTTGEAEYQTLSMTIPVNQIIEVFARHRFNVFRL